MHGTTDKVDASQVLMDSPGLHLCREAAQDRCP